MPIEVRERTDADLDACIRLVADVRRVDGYPPVLPDDDFARLLTEPASIVALVATADDDVVGHVALQHTTGVEAVDQVACDALGVAPDALGVVARLFCAIDRRRSGIGRRLLDEARTAARALADLCRCSTCGSSCEPPSLSTSRLAGHVFIP